MAWTTPTTRSTGNLITASIWNTDLVDNLILLKTSIANDGTLSSTGGTLSGPELKGYKETYTVPSISSNTLTLNYSLGNHFSVTLNANITTFTISNVPSSSFLSIVTIAFVGDGTARTITWPTTTKWAGGVAPTMTATLNKTDFITLKTYNAGTTWDGFIDGQNF